MSPRKIRTGADDDRADPEMRKRVDELVSGLDDYRRRLDARYRIVTWALIVVAVLSMLTAGFAWHNAQGTNDALCTLRGDFERRVAEGRKFLKENPEGFAGIPAATLEATIHAQERTIESLDGLDCPALPLPPTPTPTPTP
jgi:hypothetical protein